MERQIAPTPTKNEDGQLLFEILKVIQEETTLSTDGLEKLSTRALEKIKDVCRMCPQNMECNPKMETCGDLPTSVEIEGKLVCNRYCGFNQPVVISIENL